MYWNILIYKYKYAIYDYASIVNCELREICTSTWWTPAETHFQIPHHGWRIHIHLYIWICRPKRVLFRTVGMVRTLPINHFWDVPFIPRQKRDVEFLFSKAPPAEMLFRKSLWPKVADLRSLFGKVWWSVAQISRFVAYIVLDLLYYWMEYIYIYTYINSLMSHLEMDVFWNKSSQLTFNKKESSFRRLCQSTLWCFDCRNLSLITEASQFMSYEVVWNEYQLQREKQLDIFSFEQFKKH